MRCQFFGSKMRAYKECPKISKARGDNFLKLQGNLNVAGIRQY